MGHVGNKRRGNVTDDQIISAYELTRSAYKVAKELQISDKTVYRVLKLNGIECTGLQHYRETSTRFTRERELEICKRYEAGEYYAQLVEAFGGTEYSIKQAIKRAGGKLLPVTPSLSDAEKVQILAMYAEGVSQQNITEKVGRSQSTVSRFIRNEGNIYNPVRGPNHPMWKGGRSVSSDGYVRVWIEPDDPMSGMKLNDGYVAEHRLVMARKIGRPLRSNETVHHNDGNRGNNHPDNLQLRHGKHGKHVVMVCGDCGSHNIVHASL